MKNSILFSLMSVLLMTTSGVGYAQGFGEAMSGVASGAVSGAKSAVTGAANAVSGVAQGAANLVTKPLDTLSGAVSGVKDSIKGTIADLKTVKNGADNVQVGWTIIEDPIAHIACCDISPEFCVCPPNIPFAFSFWLDPALIAATALDYAANMDENERTIDAADAIEELEKSLKSGCSGSGNSGKETSLDETDTVVVAPEIVVQASQKDENFVAVRSAVEDYLFETEECSHDCVLERQNTWLLTSLDLAAAMSDKLLSASTTMESEYGSLLSGFNSQKSPMGMWGASAQITLHTHVQTNDMNALYARDLEMNALNGVRDAEDTRLIPRDQPLVAE